MTPLSLPRRVEAVVFDMDGVLVDSERMFRDAMLEVSLARGHELPLAVFHLMVGAPREQNRLVALDHFGADFDFEDWVGEVNALALSRMAGQENLKPGARELIDDLEARGLPRAVATSAGHRAVARQLGPSGLDTRFQVIVGRGDYERGKPHPDPFLLAARRLGVAPEACLALEDSHNGVRAAAGAGMMTIMVPDLLEATAEIAALCIGVVPDLHRVRELLGPVIQADWNLARRPLAAIGLAGEAGPGLAAAKGPHQAT
jgi:HAD superfamily hydrolase (TIGR01509 family)